MVKEAVFSDDPFSLPVTITAGTNVNNYVNYLNDFAIDTLTFGGSPTAVPEPSSVVMMLMGAVGVGGVVLVRRKR